MATTTKAAAPAKKSGFQGVKAADLLLTSAESWLLGAC